MAGKGHKVDSVSSKSVRIVRSGSPTVTIFDERLVHDLDTKTSEIIEQTFPPRGAILSDSKLGRICDSKLPTVERGAIG